jgi:4-amino-4-deoxy-L-arabinose transferase-like glycosyltransferase
VDFLSEPSGGPRKRRRGAIIMLIIILALACLLRVVNIGHVLTWDEAWNVNTIVDGATGQTADPLFENFYLHPPGYNGLGIAFDWMTGMGRHGLAIAMEVISILFGLGLVFAVFLCARDWFGVEAALAAAFLMAVMPAARTFDTWIKQDSMVLFLCVMFLFFFFRKKFIVAGLFFGLALFTKETAIFVAIAAALFVVLVRRPKMIRGLAIAGGIAALICGWWYIFFSRSKGEFLSFFIGKGQEPQIWHQGWGYYLGRSPQDLGLLALACIALAVGLFAWRYRALSQEEGGRSGYSRRDMLVFVAAWMALVYIVLSISYGKPPYMTTTVLPAVALLGGWGLAEGLRLAFARAGATRFAFAALVLAALVLTFTLVPGRYSQGPAWLTERALLDKKIAGYVDAHKGGNGVVMMYSCDVSPTLMFYLDSYVPENIVLLTGDPTKATSSLANKSVYLVYTDQTAMDTAMDAYYLAPDYVILFTKAWGPVKQLDNVEEARSVCRALAKPVVTFNDEVDLFSGKKIHDAVAARLANGGP